MMLRSVRPLGRVSRWIPAAAYELTHELTHTLGIADCVTGVRTRWSRLCAAVLWKRDTPRFLV